MIDGITMVVHDPVSTEDETPAGTEHTEALFEIERRILDVFEHLSRQNEVDVAIREPYPGCPFGVRGMETTTRTVPYAMMMVGVTSSHDT
jgi:hypothetical protein